MFYLKYDNFDEMGGVQREGVEEALNS